MRTSAGVRSLCRLERSSSVVVQRGGAATKTISPCSLCPKKLNTEATEALSDLCG